MRTSHCLTRKIKKVQSWAHAGGSLSPTCIDQPNHLRTGPGWNRPRTRLRGRDQASDTGSELPGPELLRTVCFASDSTAQRGLTLCLGLQCRVKLILLRQDPCLIQKGTIQLHNTSMTVYRDRFPFTTASGVHAVLVHATGARRLPLLPPSTHGLSFSSNYRQRS